MVRFCEWWGLLIIAFCRKLRSAIFLFGQYLGPPNFSFYYVAPGVLMDLYARTILAMSKHPLTEHFNFLYFMGVAK